MSLRAHLNTPPPASALTESLFLRLLGLVYLSAFASLWPQIKGLLGDHGIAPATEALQALHNAFGPKAWFYVPTLFWFNASNTALTAACIAGCIAALFLLSGLLTRYAAALCFVLYLSLTTAGQPFTGFQWDALLLECGFLALFSGAPWLIWAYRFLLFRLMFESGVVKLTSHDPNWRNLHALRFHFFTQPLPTPLAYYAAHAPLWLLDSLTAATLVIELLIPFLIFLPRPFRRVAGLLFIALQLVILLTGNYAFFNLLTLSLCLWCFEDATYSPLRSLLQRAWPAHAVWTGKPAIAANVTLAVLMLAGLLQVEATVLPASRRLVRTITFPIEPFEIVNSYGLFAVMTTSRPELVLEGSDDQIHWTEYSFRYKAGPLHRGLPLIAPYQPRLDWQMWFAALATYQENPWAATLIFRLLQNEPSVTGLLDPPPFSKAPKYVRVLLYKYTFSSPAERSRTGQIWNREYKGNWLETISLPDGTSSKP
jgi:hypothetical protein